MKTKLPTAVTIRGFEYSIEYVSQYQEVDTNLVLTDLVGQVSSGNPGCIHVLATQPPIGILDTLIHEILHVIFARNAVLTAAIRPEIGDEAFVTTLGNELAVLLTENKWINMPAHVTPTIRRITGV
jgi:hypothetical protein